MFYFSFKNRMLASIVAARAFRDGGPSMPSFRNVSFAQDAVLVVPAAWEKALIEGLALFDRCECRCEIRSVMPAVLKSGEQAILALAAFLGEDLFLPRSVRPLAPERFRSGVSHPYFDDGKDPDDSRFGDMGGIPFAMLADSRSALSWLNDLLEGVGDICVLCGGRALKSGLFKALEPEWPLCEGCRAEALEAMGVPAWAAGRPPRDWKPGAPSLRSDDEDEEENEEEGLFGKG